MKKTVYYVGQISEENKERMIKYFNGEKPSYYFIFVSDELFQPSEDGIIKLYIIEATQS